MRSFLCLVVLFGLCSLGKAEIFTHNFDMNDDYTQYLYSTSNVAVGVEQWPYSTCSFWYSTSSTQVGQVIYKYDLPFGIQSASLFAQLDNVNNGAKNTYVDISPDGVNWTNLASNSWWSPLKTPLESQLLRGPVDVSVVLQGSHTAYVRARLDGTNGTWGYAAQFLRTDDYVPYEHSPYTYQFQASDMPEPNTIILLVAGGSFLFMFRRKFIK